MFLLFGWNYWNGDYDAYENLYKNSFIEFAAGGYEWGYTGVMMLISMYGYDFQQFFIIMAFISLLLFFNFCIRFSQYPALFSCCFFICFFPLDYVLLRNFIAFTIVLQGLIFVINNHKYRIGFFIFFVLIASLFHSTSIFYLCLLYCFKKEHVDIAMIFLLIFIVTLIFSQVGSVILNKIVGTSNGRIDLYDSSLLRFFYNSFIQIINLFIIKYFYKVSKKDICTSDVHKRFNRIIMNINIILLFLIPLYYIFAIAERLFRNIAIINVIVMINILMQCSSRYRKKILITLLFCYLMYFYFWFIHPYYEDTVHSLYKYNLLFDQVKN
jgi:hypothetical protein